MESRGGAWDEQHAIHFVFVGYTLDTHFWFSQNTCTLTPMNSYCNSRIHSGHLACANGSFPHELYVFDVFSSWVATDVLGYSLWKPGIHMKTMKKQEGDLGYPHRAHAVSCKPQDAAAKTIASSCLGKSRRATKDGGTAVESGAAVSIAAAGAMAEHSITTRTVSAPCYGLMDRRR